MIWLTALLVGMNLAHAAEEDMSEDPWMWLEEVESSEAMDWVKGQNARSQGRLEADPRFKEIQAGILEVLDSTDRIAYVSQRGEYWYNFWQDAENPRGLWRRTSPESYRSGSPEWETVLDLDALGAEEGENWVWKGSSCLAPDYNTCLLSLSRGGADAVVVREFDIATKSFVEGGYVLPEAKADVGWIDADTIFVGTDFGEGSLTDSGYPRVVKRWKRGTELASAEVVYEGEASDIAVGAYHDDTPGYERDFAYRAITFYTNELYYIGKKGLEKVEKPDGAEASVWKDHLLITLREDWEVDGTTYRAGSLLTASFKKWMKGKRDLSVLFEPDEHTSMEGFSTVKDHLILSTLEDVKSRVYVLTPSKKGWSEAPMEGLSENGTVSVWSVDSDKSNEVFVQTTDFITPSTLGYVAEPGGEYEVLAQLPAQFDAEGLEVTQHFATSKDGTKIPYFQVSKAEMTLDGEAPTLLYGYGGFEVSLKPGYRAAVGSAWLEKGGVYVVANIRGGGEYGPRWHQAALKENRLRAYEDFSAVGEDLVARKVTSPEHLGIRGGSNGGLLMGNMYTLYPDHWGAVVCQVPLLDMKRYHLLLAGASWMGEYGDPDNPDEWSFIQEWSPYQNANPEGVEYPPILITTSTRDDRVHPGHARKFAAKLVEGGEESALYYENIEGGHGGAANNAQRAFMEAMAYTFLWKTLSGEMEDADGAPTGDTPEK